MRWPGGRHRPRRRAALARSWRRSLRLRVPVTTLLLSAAVVTALGLLLLRGVGAGLLQDKLRAARALGGAGAASAQADLAQVAAEDPSTVDTKLRDITTTLATSPSAAGDYFVALLPSSSTGAASLSEALSSTDIPSALRSAVASTGTAAYTYASPRIAGRRTDSLLLGYPIAGPVGDYELYYVFPLAAEQSTLGLVRNLLLGGGVALVGLLAAVAGLVTQQVVRPVRTAAAVAERLAAGRLDERMPVRGEDELARLATGFNDMATSLQRQIRRLEDLSRLQQRFTADVSHELRTPLTTIRMAADVLHDARAAMAAPAARSAELLGEELGRFERLLADLLEISRHDAGAVLLETEPTALVALVDSELQAARRAHPQARLDLLVEVALVAPGPGADVIVEVDPRRVRRILRNLLDNAVDFGEGHPVLVTLGTAGPDPEAGVALAVTDSGVGLNPGDESRVFDRFWRADPARTRHSGGTGLGLAIAREDARLHGGRLEATGRPGQGSTFTLVLPGPVSRAPGGPAGPGQCAGPAPAVAQAPLDTHAVLGSAGPG